MRSSIKHIRGAISLLAGVMAVGCTGEILTGSAQSPGGPGDPGTGTGNPGTGNPGPGNPSTGNPGTGNPGTGNPGPGNPGTGNPGTGNPGTGNPGLEPLAGPPTRSAGARRLTREELARSLGRLFGAGVPVDTKLLPEDRLRPFDNDVLEQSPSMLLVESTETIARDVADWATAPARLQALLPCTPASATDAACFGQFIDRFGRRVLRRPLDAAFAQEMRELISYAQAPGTFASAVNVALRVFLMHPEFLYRVEVGTPVSAGKVRLTAYELATRLAFLLQGMTPDDALLAAAQDGRLDSPASLLAEAKRLLAADEGKQQLRRFHAQWLGYAALEGLPIHAKLRAESDALVDRASATEGDYRQLLLADETRIDAELATHYGLAAPAAMTWVPYGVAPRRGILSQGMFAAAGAKFTDTSPTRRGKFIRERLLCTVVPLPPPEESVDIDLPPAAKTPDACKTERYRQHREDGACAGCHALMDPIGFGLENFDELGRYRTHDKDRPDCPIDGKGALDGNTPFTGAKQLADLIAASPLFAPCVGEHYLRFAMGRSLDAADYRRAAWLGQSLTGNGHHLSAMVLAFVTHDNFRLREE